MNAHPGLEKILDWLLSHSWQAGVLVLLVLAVQWVFQRQLANRWRFALWWIVLVRLLLPFSPQSAISVFNVVHPTVHLEESHATTPVSAPLAVNNESEPVKASIPSTLTSDNSTPRQSFAPSPAAPVEPAPVSTIVAAPIQPVPHHAMTSREFWISLVTGIWMVGVLFLTGFVLIQLISFQWRLKSASSPADARLETLLDDCRRGFGLARRVELLETDAVQSPALFGLLRLRLLVPLGFGREFGERELRYIFLHELAHVKRGDLWLNWLITFLQIMHWFNPLLWLGFARLRADRELACDELALVHAGDGTGATYGETIVKLLENLSRPKSIPGLVGILEDKNQMRRRIAMIARFRRPGRWSALALLLIAVVGIAALTDAQTEKAGNAGRHAESVTTNQTAVASPVAPRPVVTDGPAIKVTVLDDATGQPLADADVYAPNEAAYFTGRENSPRWITDQNGVAVIRAGEPSANSVWKMTWFTLSARKPGYAPVGMGWSTSTNDVRPELPAKIIVRLKPGTRIGGVVRDEHGAPQAGLRVRVFGTGYAFTGAGGTNSAYPEFWNDSAGMPLPMTDANGRWEVADFPADLPNVAIEFIRPDGSVGKFRHRVREINMFNDPQGDEVDLSDLLAGKAQFVLKPGAEIHGITVDTQGRPVPDVHIQMGYGMVNYEHAAEVRSDASGRFVLRHVNRRQAVLTADAPGYAITSLIVDLQSNVPETHLRLDELAPLHIHVLDGRGNPLPGVRVSTQPYRTEGQLLDFAATTDDQGDLTWTNAPVSTFALSADSKNPAVNQVIIRQPEQHPLTFHLRAGMSESAVIKVHVTDSVTGKPVKLESAKFQTGDREGYKFDAEVTDTGFQLTLPASRFRPGMYPSYQFQLKASGYKTLITPWRDFDEGDWNADLTMQATAASAAGIVSLPDGQPASKARAWTRQENIGELLMDGGNMYFDSQMLRISVDEKGSFTLPDVPDDEPVIFAHTNGFLATIAAEVRKNPNVRLQPLGKVSGVLKVAGQIKGRTSVSLESLQWSPNMGFHLSYNTTTATDGSFIFDHVPAGEYKLYRYQFPRGRTSGAITEEYQMPLAVQAGQTTTIEYSNSGRPVIGQAVSDPPSLAIDWQNDDHTLVLQVPTVAAPDVNPQDFVSRKDFEAARNQSYQSSARLQQTREARTYVLKFEPDGSFRVEDVPPGKYVLTINATKPDPKRQYNPFNSAESLATLTREVTVPAGDKPFDLGTLNVPVKDANSVKAAPSLDFAASTLDGKFTRLAQYKGKYVVVAFWAAWSDRSTEGCKTLQTLQSSLGQNPRVAFLGVSLDEDANAVAKTVAERGYSWPQAILDSTNRANVTAKFDVSSLPQICLVDPDGRIIGRDLDGDRLTAAVQRALQK